MLAFFLRSSLIVDNTRRPVNVAALDFPRLVAGSRGSSMRYNPVELSDPQIEGILRAAL